MGQCFSRNARGAENPSALERMSGNGSGGNKSMMTGYSSAAVRVTAKKSSGVVVIPDSDHLSDEEELDETEEATDRSSEDYMITEPVLRGERSVSGVAGSRRRDKKIARKLQVEKMLDEENNNNAAVLRKILEQQNTPKEPLLHQIKEDPDDEAPSDEESTRRMPGMSSSRSSTNRKQKQPVGRLSPVKLKTQWSANPASIQFHQPPPVPLPVPPELQPSRDAAVLDAAVSNFQKLKLQVAVSERQVVQQKRTAKVEDRVRDVSGYKELWKEYEQIQAAVVKTAEMAPKRNAEPLVEGPENADDSARMSKRSFFGRKNSRKEMKFEYDMEEEEQVEVYPVDDDDASKTSRRSFFSRKSKNSKKSNSVPKTPDRNQSKKPKEHDRDDVSKTSRRSWISRSSKKSKKAAPVIEFDMGADPSPRTTKDKAGERSSFSGSKKSRDKKKAVSKNATQNRKQRGDSFDLKDTQKWYFDFQDEFDPTAGTGAITVGSNHSQTSLSLLSESSMEVQRRLFKEKRRERKQKKYKGTPRSQETPIKSNCTEYAITSSTSYGAAIELDLQDSLPPPTRTASRRTSSNNSAGSNDYGPARRRTSTRKEPSASVAKKHASALTDMEVVVTPDREDDDNVSQVSEFDENGSYASKNNSTVNNDYRVSKRRQATDRSVDNSTIASDGIESLPDIAYDHKTVLQRRLDIEKRLRALQADDDDNEAAPDQAETTTGLASQDYSLPAVVSPDGGYRQHKRDTASFRSPVAMASMLTGGIVTPLAAEKEELSLQKMGVQHEVSPPSFTPISMPKRSVQDGTSKTHRAADPTGQPPRATLEYDLRKPKADAKPKDYQKLLASALLNDHESVERNEQAVPVPRSLQTLESNKRLLQNGGSRTLVPASKYGYSPRPVSHGLDNKAAALYPMLQGANQNQSFESVESQAMHTALPYLQDKSTSKKMLGVSKTEHDDSESERQHQSRSFGGSREDKDALVVNRIVLSKHFDDKRDQQLRQVLSKESDSGSGPDETHETLLLADKVEAHVKDVLGKFRSEESDDQPPRINTSTRTARKVDSRN